MEVTTSNEVCLCNLGAHGENRTSGGVTEDTFTADVPSATVDGEDEIVGEIKNVKTILFQALTPPSHHQLRRVGITKHLSHNTHHFLKQYVNSFEQVCI